MSSATTLPVDGEKLFRHYEIHCWIVFLVTIPLFGLGVLLYIFHRFWWQETLKSSCLGMSAEIRDDTLTIRFPGPFGRTDHIPLSLILYTSVVHGPIMNSLGICRIHLFCTPGTWSSTQFAIPGVPIEKADETVELLRLHQDRHAQQSVVSDADVR